MNYRRAFVPNGYLHIIITSYDRKPIFIENIDILRTAFKNTKTIYEFEIIAICVLPNHIHLILHPNNIEQYPQIISSIKHYFSRNVGQVCPTCLLQKFASLLFKIKIMISIIPALLFLLKELWTT